MRLRFFVLAGLLAGLIVGVVLLAMSFRYRIALVQDDSVSRPIYVIDNWTGRLQLCFLRSKPQSSGGEIECFSKVRE